MKTLLVRLFSVFIFFILIRFATAGDFVSTVIQAGQSPLQIIVPADRFLVIRNFTQETGATMRGSVSVMTSTFTANNVITATLLDPNNTTPGSLEVINNIAIAGPATVTVTPGDTNCFITYRKGTD